MNAKKWLRLGLCMAALGGLALACSGPDKKRDKPSWRVEKNRKKGRKKPKHAPHEHPHAHPHGPSDHHHHAHPHPHLPGPDGHHHPY